MNTTSINIKVTPDIKKQAQHIANELGLSLDAVIKAFLKQFIRTKKISAEISEIPNAYLKKSLKQSNLDIKHGRTIIFKNGHEALNYIDNLIQNAKNKQQKTH